MHKLNRFILAAGIVLAVLAAIGAARAQDDTIGYRGLTAADFQGTVPAEADRQQGAITIQGAASTGIASTYGFGSGPGGAITVDPPSYSSIFDRAASWLNADGRTPAEQAETLRHEQAHFDISEGFAQALNAARERIRQEIQNTLNGDPALRDQFNALGTQIAQAEQQIAAARAELDNTTTPPTPERRAELEAQIQTLTGQRDAASDQQTAMAEAASPTLQRLTAEHDRQQTAYDDETEHGTNAARQAEWEARARRNLTGWQPDPPQAGSAAGNSLHYDAATRTLSLTDDVIVDVDGATGDPVVGAELILPDYTLTGQTVFGAPIFTATGGTARLVQGGMTLLEGRIDTLFFLADENRFLGVMNDPVLYSIPGFSSPFLDQSILGLASPGGGLLTLGLFPEGVDFGVATDGFTLSADAPITNGFGRARLVPEPDTALLFAAALSFLVLAAARRRPATGRLRCWAA